MAGATGKTNLINRTAVKELILRRREKLRPGWDCSRVSAKALNQIEACLRMIIDNAIQSHPTRGKTFIDFQA